jgi:hypothetical protein
MQDTETNTEMELTVKLGLTALQVSMVQWGLKEIRVILEHMEWPETKATKVIWDQLAQLETKVSKVNREMSVRKV